MPEFTVSEHSPAAEEFVSLRENCGLEPVGIKEAEADLGS